MRGVRWERQDSLGPRDPKVFLGDLEKMELQDTRELQVDKEKEDPKESVVIQEFLEKEAFRARGVAQESPAKLDPSVPRGKKVIPALQDSWGVKASWMTPALQRNSGCLSEMKYRGFLKRSFLATAGYRRHLQAS